MCICSLGIHIRDTAIFTINVFVKKRQKIVVHDVTGGERFPKEALR